MTKISGGKWVKKKGQNTKGKKGKTENRPTSAVDSAFEETE